jgi:hypothetical protein
MSPTHFPGYGVGQQKGLLVLDRDVTIRGADPDNSTVIDWNMLDATVLLKAGRVLTFQDLTVTNVRCARREGLQCGAVRCGLRSGIAGSVGALVIGGGMLALRSARGW